MAKPSKKKNQPIKKEPATKGMALNNEAKAWKTKWMLIIFAFGALLYANTIPNGYAFDDEVAITDNSFTQQGIKGIPDLLTKDFFAGIYGQGLELGGGRYRPLSLIMFAVEHELFGNNATPSHVINILLYGLVGVVLFLLLLDLFPKQPLLPVVATLLFMAHPIHTEVVANIKSRDEILSFLFLCLTLRYVLKYAHAAGGKTLAYGCICYFLALLSKENGITFLAVIPLTIYVFTDKKSISTILKKSLPFFITAIIYVTIRVALVGMVNDTSTDIMESPFINTSLMNKLATISWISVKYLLLLIIPYPLSSDYSFNQIPIINWLNLKAIIPIILQLALVVWAFVQLKNKNVLAYCVFFYFITYSIVSNIVFNIGAPMGERFLFLPSLAFCIAAAWFLLKYLNKATPAGTKFSGVLTGVLMVVLLVYSVEVYARNQDWKDNITLFKVDSKTVPNSAKVHYYYANSLLGKANLLKDSDPQKLPLLDTAKHEFLRSVAINPKFHTAFYDLGVVYNDENKPDSAIYYLNIVLQLQPLHILTQSLLGRIYGTQKGDLDHAIEHLKLAVHYDAKDDASWQNLGVAYAMKQQYNDALNAFTHVQQLKPNDAQSYMNLAITYQNLGEKDKADESFSKAFAIDPSLKK